MGPAREAAREGGVPQGRGGVGAGGWGACTGGEVAGGEGVWGEVRGGGEGAVRMGEG